MSPRRRPLEVLVERGDWLCGAGALVLLSGCTDPLVGDWLLTEIDVDGVDFNGLSYHYTYNGYYDGCGWYTYVVDMELSGELSVAEDFDADFDLSYSYSLKFSSQDCGGAEESASGTDTYSGEAHEGGDKGEYKISLKGEERMKLTCQLNDDSDELECDDDDGILLIFERD